jgi:LmbE family N-acetylglucosaminyl deacetylase
VKPDSPARAVLNALKARVPTDVPVALVAAHPDDETIGAGASLALFRNLLIVHVTDGAPRNLRDARAHGFDSAEAYASARRKELKEALRAGSVRAEHAMLGAPDQESALRMGELAGDLVHHLARFRPACLITHAYEGGHPDHDSTCLIARLACTKCDPPPAILEMAGYFANVDGELVIGGFVGEPAALVALLGPVEQGRREAMLGCFRTQRSTLAPFRGMERESFRLGPPCDFSVAPHPGTLWYEHFDWGMTGPRWRELARQALAEWGV